MIVIFYTLQSSAVFIGYNLNGEVPESQCMLIAHDTLLNAKIGTCSGTYLNKNVFLTAAHCFKKLSLGNSFEDGVNYIIECKTGQKLVNAVAVHPLYYSNVEDVLDFNDDIFSNGVELKSDLLLSLDYNDIALAHTDDVHIENFPDINFDSTFDPQENSCHFLGFSPSICDPFSGDGCYRSNFSVMPSQGSGNFKCNLTTKDNCYFLESEMRSSLYFYTQEGSVTAKGDSGAGILCQNKNSGKEALIGVYTSSDVENQILSVTNRSDFILEYLNLNKNDFLEKSKNYKIDPVLKSNLILARNIERIIVEYDISISDNGLLSGGAVLSRLKSWIEDDFTLATFLLEKKEITKILIDDFSFGVLEDIRGIKAYIRDDIFRKTLIIHSEAETDHIKRALL